MVDPIYIIIFSLAIGFLMSLFDKVSRKLSLIAFYGILTFDLVAVADWFYRFVYLSAETVKISTAGFAAPLSINLQLGLLESFVMLFMNLVALFAAIFLFGKFKKGQISAMILYVVLVMGANGLVMTRDLFNMFVFLEILSISTYALTILDKFQHRVYR